MYFPAANHSLITPTFGVTIKIEHARGTHNMARKFDSVACPSARSESPFDIEV
jgi:hypothetical protein